MPAERGIKRIHLSRATNLPRLDSPAGYVVVLEDVELGNRFKVARLQEVNSRTLARVTDLAFETELFLLLSAANAAALALELQDRFAAAGDSDEWFDLDRSQVARLRNFGRPQAPSLRDLALSEADGQALVEEAQVISAPSPARPAQTRARKRPQRRWTAWLLLLATVTLGASILGNAPQLRRLLSGRGASPPMPAALASPAPAEAAATSPPSATAIVRAGDVFYVLARANARVCASRACRAVVILNVGVQILAQGYESGESIDGNNTWIAFKRGGATLYVHSAALSLTKPDVGSAARPTAAATFTVVPSATRATEPTDTATPTNTLEPTNSVAPAAAASPTVTRPTASATKIFTATESATSTSEATATATPTPAESPTASATMAPTVTNLPAVLYIDTANNLNANIRACSSTDCDILGSLGPGAEIRPIAEVAGQIINGIGFWIEFDYAGQPAFVHGELVAESR